MAKMSGSNPPSSANRSKRTRVHPPGAEKDVAHRVVLTVVDLSRLHTVDDGAAFVHRHADVQQLRGVVPIDQLRRHDAGVGAERFLHEDVDCVGVRSDSS